MNRSDCVFMPNEYWRDHGSYPQWSLYKEAEKSFYGKLKEEGTFSTLARALLCLITIILYDLFKGPAMETPFKKTKGIIIHNSLLCFAI